MRSIDLTMAFSLNKQAVIGTAMADIALDRMLPFRTFAPSVQEFPNSISDKDWYGKGHSFATFWDPITKQVTVPSREYSLSNLSALFAPAFVMGKLVTTQPNSSTAPTVFDHKFTFQDPISYPETLYTAFIEKMGSIYQRKVIGAVIEQFTLTGQRTDHVVVAWQGFAREMEASVAAMPSMVAQSFFKTICGTFKFNASGSGIVDVSTKLLSWNLTINQAPNKFWLPGNGVGKESFLSKNRVGKQGVSGQMVVLLEDAVQKALFEANTECELSIVIQGDLIPTTTYYNTVTILIPHFKIPTEAFGEEQDQVSHTLPFNEQTIFKSGSDDVVSITVRGTEDATKLLVAA